MREWFRWMLYAWKLGSWRIDADIAELRGMAPLAQSREGVSKVHGKRDVVSGRGVKRGTVLHLSHRTRS